MGWRKDADTGKGLGTIPRNDERLLRAVCWRGERSDRSLGETIERYDRHKGEDRSVGLQQGVDRSVCSCEIFAKRTDLEPEELGMQIPSLVH